MALYEFKCPNRECEVGKFTEFMDMHGDHTAHCPQCGTTAHRVFNPAYMKVEFRAGYDHGLGKYVGSKKERDNLLDKYGMVKK